MTPQSQCLTPSIASIAPAPALPPSYDSNPVHVLTMKQLQIRIHRQLHAALKSMISIMSGAPRYRDNEDDPFEDQFEATDNGIPAAQPRWSPRLECLRNSRISCWPSRQSSAGRGSRRRRCRPIVIAVVVLTLLGGIAAVLVTL